ncbi:hypothetical protein GN956_G25878 [Arapaima gigas]
MTESWVSAERGGSVTIPCHYDQKYKHRVKYWCRGGSWSHCVTVVRTDSPQRRGEVSITNHPDQLLFIVTVRNLQEKDSGWYWCGLKRNWNANVAAMLVLLSVGKGELISIHDAGLLIYTCLNSSTSVDLMALKGSYFRSSTQVLSTPLSEKLSATLIAPPVVSCPRGTGV